MEYEYNEININVIIPKIKLISVVKEIARAKIVYVFINCSKLRSVEICGSSISSPISMSVSETRNMNLLHYYSGDGWIQRNSSKPSNL